MGEAMQMEMFGDWRCEPMDCEPFETGTGEPDLDGIDDPRDVPELANVQGLFPPKDMADDGRGTYRVYLFQYTPPKGRSLCYVGITGMEFGAREYGHFDKAIRKSKGSAMYRHLMQAIADELPGAEYLPAYRFADSRDEAAAIEAETIRGFEALGWHVVNRRRKGGEGADIGNAAMTHEEYVSRLEGRSIAALERYAGSATKIRHKCLQPDCGYEWRVAPLQVMRGRGCPQCWHARRGEAQRIWTVEKAEQKLVAAIQNGVKTRADLMAGNSGLYDWLRRSAPHLLDKNLPLMCVINRTSEVAEAELLTAIANGVKSRADLRRTNSGLEYWLRKNAPHLLDLHLPSRQQRKS